jgi:putative addiction module component (TIGR02574 family)
MPRTLQELEVEVLNLSVEARGQLTQRLLESLEPSEAEIHESWVREAERRAEEMRSGQVRGEPARQVLQRIRSKLA